MSGSKKYYWLKLQKDFFKRHDIRIIEEQKNGKDYVLFYVKLLAESVTHKGELRFSETIPYNEEMLATITNTNVDIVRSAMVLLKQLGLMEVLKDGTIYMIETNKLIGQETEYARRKRDYRQRIALQKQDESETNKDNVETIKDNVRQEIEIEIDIEKDKELKEKEYKKKKTLSLKKPYGEFGKVLLTDNEHEKLEQHFKEHYSNYIKDLDLYIEGSGKKYKSHYAVIRQWLNRDQIKEQKTKREKTEENIKAEEEVADIVNFIENMKNNA